MSKETAGQGPVDRLVRPVAWMMTNRSHKLTPSLHWEPQERWHATWVAEPLYGQPAIDAAVAAERERWAADVRHAVAMLRAGDAQLAERVLSQIVGA